MAKNNLNFDEEKANNHLKKLLRQYKIKVTKWSIGSCGRAWPSIKKIKIPKPTDIDRFCVCMHEIKHVIDGISGKLYQREYFCEKFAIEQAELLNFDCTQYKERARRYVIMCIAKGYCRKLNLLKIDPEIKEFCAINFKEWKDKKVFIRGWGSGVRRGEPLEIILT